MQIEFELSQLSYPAKYRTLTWISACCNWAVHSKLISHNPFWVIVDGLKAPNTDTNPYPFTREETNRIIKAYETHPRYSYFAPFVIFLFLTGCRTGEAVALRWKSVTENFIIFCESISFVGGKHLHSNRTKTGKSREFPLTNPALKKLLNALKPENVNPDDFVFQQPGGGHIKIPTFRYSWYGTKSNYKNRSHFSPGIVSNLASKSEAEGGIDQYRCAYSTRHTFITLALDRQSNFPSDSNISQLAKYVGNSPAVIYKHYLGRSGNEDLVNIDLNSPSPQAPEDGKSSIDELLAQLAAANQRIDELLAQLATANQHINGLTSLVQTLTSSQRLPAPVEPASEPELPLPTPSKTAPPVPPQPNGKALFQKWHPTKPAEEYEQLALFMSLEEMVNPKEE